MLIVLRVMCCIGWSKMVERKQIEVSREIYDKLLSWKLELEQIFKCCLSFDDVLRVIVLLKDLNCQFQELSLLFEDTKDGC